MKTVWWVLLGLGILLAVLFTPFGGQAQVPSVTLEWTAPGDDGMSGTANFYTVRYSTAKPDTTGLSAAPKRITAPLNTWWSTATTVTGLPNPQIAGTKQSMTISSGLSYATTYYFLMIACDEVPNASGYSNLAVKVLAAAPDTTAPRSIIDLIVK